MPRVQDNLATSLASQVPSTVPKNVIPDTNFTYTSKTIAHIDHNERKFQKERKLGVQNRPKRI